MAAAGNFLVPGGPPGMRNPADETKIMMALDKGRALMEDEDYYRAMRALMQAVDLCPCARSQARHGKDKSCNVQECIAALMEEDDLEALDNVAHGPCACGYKWPSCVLPTHALVLDALAECLDKAEQHLSAFSTALSTIRLNSRSAIGYCRTAKMLQKMLKNSTVSSTTALSRAQDAIVKGHGSLPPAQLLRQLLVRVVESGLHNTPYGPKDTYDVVLQRMGHALRIKQARRDPARTFPPEVFGMVLANLTSADLSRCIRVNKQWKQALERDNTLWANLEYGRPRNPNRFLGKFLRRHPGIKSLIIRDASAFNITEAKLNTIFHGLRHLRRLVLRSGMPNHGSQNVEFNIEARPGAPVPGAALRQLSLISYAFDTRSWVPSGLDLSSLLILDLVDGGRNLPYFFINMDLPSLVKLRMIDTQKRRIADYDDMATLEIEHVMHGTPNLKELQLDGFHVTWVTDLYPADNKHTYWRGLEVLVFGPRVRHVVEALEAPWNARLVPELPSTLRRIEILSPMPEMAHRVLFARDPYYLSKDENGQTDWQEPLPGSLMPHLPNLEVFRCLAGMLDPAHLEAVIAPAIRSGSLKVLELSASSDPASVPLITMANPVLQDNFIPVRDFVCANSDSLQVLGLHNFNFHRDPASRFGASSAFDGRPFLDWLECFPSVNTVAVYPGEWEGVDMFIMRLITHPRIKVVYQRNLKGAAWDQALALAKRHGVNLIHKPDNSINEWPVIDDWVMRD